MSQVHPPSWQGWNMPSTSTYARADRDTDTDLGDSAVGVAGGVALERRGALVPPKIELGGGAGAEQGRGASRGSTTSSRGGAETDLSSVAVIPPMQVSCHVSRVTNNGHVSRCRSAPGTSWCTAGSWPTRPVVMVSGSCYHEGCGAVNY